MKWEWQVWRRHWLNWLVLPLTLIFLIASYGLLTQQKQRVNVATINRLVNEHDALEQNLSELGKQSQTHRVVNEKRLIRQQLTRLQGYVSALKANRHNLVHRRLVYEQGMLAHPVLLAMQSKQKVRVAIKRDQAIIARGMLASEANDGMSAGEFLLRLQNPITFGFLLIVVIFCTAGLFTRDWHGMGWKMQYLLPRPRPRLLWDKLGLASLVTVGCLMVFGVTALVVAGVFTHDLGGWRYPVVGANQTLMTRAMLITLGCALMVVWAGFLLSVVELVGIWISDRFVTVLVLSAVVVIGSVLFHHAAMNQVQVLNPLSQLSLINNYAKQAPAKLVGLAVIADVSWTAVVGLVGIPLRRRILLLHS